MAKGSLFKEVAKDGAVSWRVRVDMMDPVSTRGGSSLHRSAPPDGR